MAATTDDDFTASARSRRTTLLREALGASIAGLLAFLGFWRISGVSWRDIGSLWGRSDAIVEYSMAKTQSNSILGLFDPNLGYPHGQDWTHFPVLDAANRIELSLLTTFLNPVTAVNVLFVLSFPMIAILMYAALRNLYVLRSLAVVGGVSLALVGYHFDYEHPFLGNYWAVPVGVVWLSILANSDTVLSARCRTRTVLAVGGLSAVMIGIHNPQYAVFFSLIGVIAVIFARRHSQGSLRLLPRLVILLIPGLALLALLVLGRLLRTVPAVTSSTDRPVEDSYIWAGQFISLLTTPGDSILGGLPFNTGLLAAQDTTVWTGVSAIQSAPVAAATIVVIGFTLSLIAVTRPPTRQWERLTDRVRPWSVMWLTGAAFFITGGIGVAFAALVHPQVRSWSRVSILLAALALTGALILATGVVQRWSAYQSRKSSLLRASLTVFIAILFLDQFTARYPLQTDATTLPALNKLGETSSAELPDDCPILGIPVMAFPEAIPLGRMQAYDHLLPYLSDTPWRLSYGAVRGQLGSRWTDHLAVQPEPLAQQVAAEGFCGVLVDTYGLDQNSPSLQQYEEALGPPLATALERWFVFALPASEPADASQSLFSRPEVDYGSDLTPEEITDEGLVSRWTQGPESTLRVWNPGPQPVELIARTTLTAATCPNEQKVQLVTSSGYSESLRILPGEEREVFIPLRVPAQDKVVVRVMTPSAGCPQGEYSRPVGVRMTDLRFTSNRQPGADIATLTGFFPEETGPSGETWRWIDGDTAIAQLLSTSSEPITVALSGSLQSPPCQTTQVVEVTVDGRLVQAVTVTAQALTPLKVPIDLDPFEAASITFSSSTPGCLVASDERLLGPKVQSIDISSSAGNG